MKEKHLIFWNCSHLNIVLLLKQVIIFLIPQVPLFSVSCITKFKIYSQVCMTIVTPNQILPRGTTTFLTRKTEKCKKR